MKFGEIRVADAAGAVLAHSLKLAGRSLKKGHRLTAEDVTALSEAGHLTVIAATLEAGDIDENSAAQALAAPLSGAHVRLGPPFTGRVNLYSEVSGILLFDRAAIDRFNGVDETITLAVLEPYTVVAPKQMVGTIKIIPFAVKRDAVTACLDAVGGAAPLLRIAPFTARRAALIQTRLPGLKETALDKTVTATQERLEALGSRLVLERRCAHRTEDLAPQIAAAAEQCDLVLVAGASAIVDRRDVIPAAITSLGGTIDHFGMPVDPGNLMLMGRLGAVAVLGLPGCARSPKVNGFDWVLQRLLAGLPIGASEIMRMGVGGLLAEIPSRPLPRAKAVAAPAPDVPRAPRIAAVVLAAGQSRRMGTLNKLLITIDGTAMVRRVVDAIRASQASPVVVVTGHERERVEAALAGLGDLRIVVNPDYAKGLSTSLKAGIAALPGDVDGALICLGDMPLVASGELDRLMAAFNPVEGRAICIPTRRGQRGNPVLLGKQFFAELSGLSGDIGARDLIARHAELVAEVEMAGDGVLTDIDTPQALARLSKGVKIGA